MFLTESIRPRPRAQEPSLPFLPSTVPFASVILSTGVQISGPVHMSRSWNASGGSQVGGGPRPDLPSPDYKPIISSQILRRGASKPTRSLSLSLFLCFSLSLRGSNLGQPNDSIPCLLTEDTSRWNRVARGLFALGGAMIFSRIHVHVFRSHRCIVILLKRFFRKRSSIGLSLSNNKMSFLVF